MTGCQGRLDLIVTNNTNIEIVVMSDGETLSLHPGDTVRIGAPASRSLVLMSESASYQFGMPFNRRPHTLNAYIDEHLVARLQINSPVTMTILPVDSTAQRTPPMSINGRLMTSGAEIR